MDNAYPIASGSHGSQLQQLGPASQEIIDLLAAAPNVLQFRSSERARKRVWELIAREKDGDLTPEEKSELDHYGQLEHIMRLVKAQARKANLSAQ